MPFDIISCQKCDEQWDSTKLWGEFKYVLDTGQEIYLDRTFGWCYHCNTFQPVEVLPKLQEIEEEIKELKNKADELNSRGFFESLFDNRSKERVSFLEEQIADAEAHIEWRKNRSSEPKCLKCSNADFEIVDYRLQESTERKLEFTHPGCGGGLVTRKSEIRLNMRLNTYLFNGDGVALKAG